MSNSPPAAPVLLSGIELALGSLPEPDGPSYVVRCSHPVEFVPPWEKIQFESYDATRYGDTVVTVAYEFDFKRQRHFTVTHSYGPKSAMVEIEGIDFDAVPARLLGDGFTPWALLEHQCLSLHAASVLVDDTLVVLAGYHDAGKSTAATYLAGQAGTQMISDDSLILQFRDDGTFASAAFWEEGCPQSPVIVSRLIFAIVDDNSGEFQDLGPVMATSQFVGGLYCSEDCFDQGVQLVQELLRRGGYRVLPNRPDAEVLDHLIDEIRSEHT